MKELDPHIEAYLNRTMDAEAMGLFSRRLVEDPGLAKAFVKAMRFDVAMRSQYLGEIEVDDLLHSLSENGMTGLDDGTGWAGWLDDLAALDCFADELQLVDATELIHAHELSEKRKYRQLAAMRACQWDRRQRAWPAQHRLSAALLTAAAVLLSLGLGLLLLVGSPPSSGVAEADPPVSVPGDGIGVDGSHSRDTGVVLTQRSAPTWAQTPDTPTSHEGTLSQGTYRLEEGVAEMAYPSGAVVTVLGPAEVELSRQNGLSVVSGKILCDIPEGAAEFQLDAGSRRFTSRGARLGMHVGGGHLASYVFSGVAEYRHGQEQLLLGKADSLLAQAGLPAVVRADTAKPNDLPEDFSGFDTFARGRILVAETFDQAAVLGRFAVTQGYVVNGSTPGRAQIRSGQLELQPGMDNTVCCYMDSDGQLMPVGTRWVVDLAEVPVFRSDDHPSLFFCISTSPAQPGSAEARNPSRNGSVGFRLRYELDRHGLRIEPDGAAPDAFTDDDQQVSGAVARLAIERLHESQFTFWFMYEGEDQWHLIGERTHQGLALDAPLYVGVEAYSSTENLRFGFDNLRLESTPN